MSEEQLEVSGAGVKVTAKGANIGRVVLAVVCGGLLAFGVWAQNSQITKQHDDIKATAAKNHEELKAANQKIETALSEIVYILALPQAEREKLDLAKPDSLRRRSRRYSD